LLQTGIAFAVYPDTTHYSASLAAYLKLNFTPAWRSLLRFGEECTLGLAGELANLVRVDDSGIRKARNYDASSAAADAASAASAVSAVSAVGAATAATAARVTFASKEMGDFGLGISILRNHPVTGLGRTRVLCPTPLELECSARGGEVCAISI